MRRKDKAVIQRNAVVNLLQRDTPAMYTVADTAGGGPWVSASDVVQVGYDAARQSASEAIQ